MPPIFKALIQTRETQWYWNRQLYFISPWSFCPENIIL